MTKRLKRGQTMKIESGSKIDDKTHEVVVQNIQTALSYLNEMREENIRFRKALMAIAVAEGREHYSQELWAALLMDKARAALMQSDNRRH
jgi:hypothetical protein